MPETKKETIQCPTCGLVMAINFSPAVLQKSAHIATRTGKLLNTCFTEGLP